MKGTASEILWPHTQASMEDDAAQVERESLAAFRLLAPWLDTLDPSELISFLSLAGHGPVPSDIALDAAAAADRLQAWAEAQKARAVARVLAAARRPDDPCHSAQVDIQHRVVVSELACALTLPEGTASVLCDRSEALVETLPETLRTLERGRISWSRAMVILEHAEGLEPDVLAEYEAAALASAPSLTRAKLARKCHRLREKLHGQPLAKRRRAAMERRGVTVDPDRDGMAWFSAYLPAEAAVAAFNRITAAAVSLQAPDEPRTLPQLRADVLSDLLLSAGALASHGGGLPQQAEFRLDAVSDHAENREAGEFREDDEGRAGVEEDREAGEDRATVGQDRAVKGGKPGPLRTAWAGIHPQVSVTVPFLTALGADLPAELEGYGPIPADVARSLAGIAPSWSRLLTDPESGAVVSVGRRSYAVPPDLRRYLRQRDLTCRFPGCSRAVRFCDVDHTKAWEEGGGTNFDNLAHLCPKHHAIKHATDWAVRTVRPGTLEWTSPTGRRYTSAAEGFAAPVVVHESQSQPDTRHTGRGSPPGPRNGGGGSPPGPRNGGGGSPPDDETEDPPPF